jgi:hypothetical protein
LSRWVVVGMDASFQSSIIELLCKLW